MLLQEKLFIRELKLGNAKAFEALYDYYHARLYGFCLKVTKTKHEAESVVQEVFIAIWENRENIDENRAFGGYIFRIAKNKILNRIKHNISRQVYLDYLQKENQSQNDLRKDIEFHELKDFLQKTIQDLPEKTRNIFLLSRNEGLTYKEIAQKLDLTENVVDHEIRKSLKHIKEQLQHFYFV